MISHRHLIGIFFWFLLFSINTSAQFIIIEKSDTSDYISNDPDFNLLVAADKGKLEDVKKFIKNGADVNTTTYDGVTPLMYAAQRGHVEIVDYLIKQDAELDKEPYDGLTALLGAAIFNQIDAAELLIRNGANINKGDNTNTTPLMYAAGYGYFVLVDLLLYYEAGLEREDEMGNTALITAVYAGNTEIVLLLLQQGADPNHTDEKGNTPLLIATQQNYDDIVSLLLDFTPTINLANNNNITPLAQAVKENNMVITKSLLNKGANVNTRITYAETPLTIAKSNKNDSIKKLLLEHGAKKNLYPSINEWQLGIQTTFNADDFYLGLTLSFYERKYKFNIITSWLTRPFRTRVLVEKEPDTYYQFWEWRNIFMAGLERSFYLYSPEYNRNILFTLGLSGAYSTANYRGYVQGPDPKIMIVPSIGIINERPGSTLRLGYTYLNLNLTDFSQHMVDLKATIRFDLEKTLFKQKRINWIDN